VSALASRGRPRKRSFRDAAALQRRPWPGVIEAYRRHLPVGKRTRVITLFEGNTPLIPAPRLAKWVGGGVRILLKFEGMNPTGSFKDRGMTMAITRAVEEGSRAVVCASTGNTAASAAAYAARAGLPCFILIPRGAVALGKMAQSLMHNAKVLQVEGNFDAALEVVRELGRLYAVNVVNSINPFRIEGQKTGSFEICDALGRPPAFHALPVGNAGNITAYWKGYREYRDLKVTRSLPRMLGFQARGAAPIVLGHPVEDPRTIATAIKIGNPASWKQAVAARDESHGLIDTVTDEEILGAYRALASEDGVFAEPASAASVAGVRKLARRGYFSGFRDRTVVCVLTGNGLKDPNTAVECFGRIGVVKPGLEDVVDALGLKGARRKG
jgi:threonine synthase